MSDFLMPIAGGLLYLLLAPILGGLLSGCDRIISARMQRRKGPPLLQPFYDFLKLWGKQPIAVNKAEGFYIFGFLLLRAGRYPARRIHTDHGECLPHHRGICCRLPLQSDRRGA